MFQGMLKLSILRKIALRLSDALGAVDEFHIK